MSDPSPDYFKDIDFDRTWEEEDWERFFAAQDRLARDGRRTRPSRPAPGVNPELSFREVLRRFGMDPDRPDVEPKPFRRISPVDETPPTAARFWEDGAPPESLGLYRQARQYADHLETLFSGPLSRFFTRVYRSRSHRECRRALIELAEHAPAIEAFVAAGHRVGYDPHGAKGNIVRCRTALRHAEACLAAAGRIPRRHLERDRLAGLFGRTWRLRNALLEWIDVLRTRFAARRIRPA
jgi:hypothetical protein